MDIGEIKATVDLLKKANVRAFVTLSELSKEMKCQKTRILSFLEENDKLVHLSQRWEPKEKVVTKFFRGRKYKETIQVRGKDLGLCIDEVFTSADQNYRTDEWICRMKSEKAKYLHISCANDYGHIIGYYVEIDKKTDTKYREYLWRNTNDKVDQIKEYLHKETFVFGGFMDSYQVKEDFAISMQSIELLKSKGWTFNDLPPITN